MDAGRFLEGLETGGFSGLVLHPQSKTLDDVGSRKDVVFFQIWLARFGSNIGTPRTLPGGRASPLHIKQEVRYYNLPSPGRKART